MIKTSSLLAIFKLFLAIDSRVATDEKFLISFFNSIFLSSASSSVFAIVAIFCLYATILEILRIALNDICARHNSKIIVKNE